MTLKAVSEVIKKARGYSWDGVCLAVATHQSTVPYLDKDVDEWEDICRSFDFEYIDAEAKGRNDYGGMLG